MTLPAWASPDELKPAPEPLLLVQAFVNTRDQSLGTDLLADADAARTGAATGGRRRPRSAPMTCARPGTSGRASGP